MRRKACRGDLPVSLQEKIEILVLLAVDNDEESRNSAFHTLEYWVPAELQKVLSNPSTPVGVLEFVAYNLAPGRKELEEALLLNPSLPGPLREWMVDVVALFAEAESSESAEASVPLQSADEVIDSSRVEELRERTSVMLRIRRMSPFQKVKTALIGSQEERMCLVRDANKLVARAVLQSPKVSDHEAENFASMKDISEELLRLIAQSRRFMKNYAVLRALVNNPRTPIDAGLPLLHYISDRDLKGVVFNRNVSDVIRSTASKFIRQKEEANKPKFGKH